MMALSVQGTNRIILLFLLGSLVSGLDQPLLLLSIPNAGEFPLDRGIYKISESDDTIATKIPLADTIARKYGIAYDPVENRIYYKDATSTTISSDDYDDQYGQFSRDFNVAPETTSVAIVKASLDGSVKDTFYTGVDLKVGFYTLTIVAINRKLYYGTETTYNRGIFEFDLTAGTYRRLFPTRDVQQMFTDPTTGDLWWSSRVEILKANFANAPTYRTVLTTDPGYPIGVFTGQGTSASKAFYVQNVPDVGAVMYTTDIDSADTTFDKILIQSDSKYKGVDDYSTAAVHDGFMYIYEPVYCDILKYTVPTTETTDPSSVTTYDRGCADGIIHQIAVIENAVGATPASTFLLVGVNSNILEKFTLALDSPPVTITPSVPVAVESYFVYDPTDEVVYYKTSLSKNYGIIYSMDLDGANPVDLGFQIKNYDIGLFLDNARRFLYVVYFDKEFRIEELNLDGSLSSRELYSSETLDFFGCRFDSFQNRIIMPENDGLVFLPIDDFNMPGVEVVTKAVTPYVDVSPESFQIKGFTADTEYNRIYFGVSFFNIDKFELRSVGMYGAISDSTTWSVMDSKSPAFLLISEEVFNNKIYGFSNAEGLLRYDTSDLSVGPLAIKTDLFDMVGANEDDNDVEDMALITDYTTFAMESGASLTVSESDASVTIYVLRNGFMDDTATVDVLIIPLSSTNNDALSIAQATLTFGPGDIRMPAVITIQDDIVVEEDGLYELRLGNPTNGQIEGIQYQDLVLGDDDSIFWIDYLYVGIEGSSVELSIYRTGYQGRSTDVVEITLVDGSTMGSDYTAPTGADTSITFDSNVPIKTFTIPLAEDTMIEGPESFDITIDVDDTTAAFASADPSALLATVFILDKVDGPMPTIEFSAERYFVLEGESLNIKVVRLHTSGSSTGDVDITLDSTTDIGFASPDTGTETFSLTATEVEAAVEGKKDTDIEGRECVGITLALAAGTTLTDTLGDRTTAEVCVVDTSSIFWIDSVYVGVESTSVDVIIHREVYHGRSTDVVDITLAHGTTMAGDYTVPSGTVSFASNVPTAKVTIPLTDDSSEEGLEQFTVTIGVTHTATAMVASVDTSAMSATISIFDINGGPTPTIEFSAERYFVSEGENVNIIVVRLSTSGTSTGDIEVTLDSMDDIGFVSPDTGTESFTTTATEVEITVEGKTDVLVEGRECVGITLALAAGTTLTDSLGDRTTAEVCVIDTSSIFWIDSVYIGVEGSSVEAIIRREGDYGRVTDVVDVALVDGTTDSLDYAAPEGTVTFASNVPTAKVNIPLAEDALIEGPEYLTITIGVTDTTTASFGGVDLSAMTATVYILNKINQISSCVSFRSYLHIVKETGKATICLQREGNVAESGRIVINTEDVDATVDLDYIPIPTADRTVTFLAEETQVCLDIEVKDDWLKEDTEYFKVSLSELTAADAIPRCSDESALVLIKDDDDEFYFEGVTYKVKEYAGQVEIIIIRCGYFGRTSSICVSTQSGDDPRLDAQEKVDYEHISNKQIDFDINQKSEVLLINIEEDNVGEDEEQFTVMLETCSSNPNVHEEQIGFPKKTTVLISNTFTCTDPCVNGECTAENTCGCNDGYSGVVCDIPVCDVCDNGECIGINTCQCVTGWIGNGCDIPVCANSCSGNGNCIGVDVCECFAGWFGEICNTQVTTLPMTTQIEELPVGVPLVFTNDLNDPTSPAFMQLEAQLEALFGEILGGLFPDFVADDITGFSQGSVIIHHKIMVNANSDISTADINQMMSQVVDDNNVLSDALKLSTTDPLASISRCPENYCFNGGLCIETGTFYYCRCPRGFSGDQCLTVTQLEQDEEENVPDIREDTAGLSDGALLAVIIIGAIGGVASLALLGIIAFRVLSRQSKLPQQPNPPEALRMDLLPYNGLNPAYGVYNNVMGSRVLF